MQENILRAARVLRNSRHTVVFTGAGISVESGIPPFRGPDGLWSKYDPDLFHRRYFRENPENCWKLIKEVFFEFIGKTEPNAAHRAIADLEKNGYVKTIITQNIDNLHQEAGSSYVLEYHGAIRTLCCTACPKKYPRQDISLDTLPPLCPVCGGILKPDFVFFGDPIPEEVNRLSGQEARKAKAMLVVGTTGQVMPASRIPYVAKESGAAIIEVNVAESDYTPRITDIFLQGRAAQILAPLARAVIESE
ncbi:MAG: NAD-dependent deacylase [Thermodesulfobacteriota bacterium]|nr:NAD-dependent deacylase [Thermodesulfobacteriota bacterium]